MKCVLSILFTTMVLVASARQKLKDEFILNGDVVNQKEGVVYLSYINKDGKYVNDSAVIKNGSFQFSGLISEPTRSTFGGKRSGTVENYIWIFLEPANMKMTVDLNALGNVKVTGSQAQLEYEPLDRQKRKIDDKWKVVTDTLHKIARRDNFKYQELKEWILVPYNSEIKEMRFSFLSSHPDSYISAFCLGLMMYDLTTDSLKMFYTRFPEKLKRSFFGKNVLAELEKRKIGVPGTLAKDFTTTDLNGQNLSLSDYRGKYVLLDFWASWCLPCRKESPHIMELYSKYKSKGFEVICVASDDGHEDKWRAAIEQDKTGIFKHILSGYDAANNKKGIGNDYNVQTLPAQILIDPKGMIIGRYSEGVTEMEALDKKLADVMRL